MAGKRPTRRTKQAKYLGKKFLDKLAVNIKGESLVKQRLKNYVFKKENEVRRSIGAKILDKSKKGTVVKETTCWSASQRPTRQKKLGMKGSAINNGKDDRTGKMKPSSRDKVARDKLIQYRTADIGLIIIYILGELKVYVGNNGVKILRVSEVYKNWTKLPACSCRGTKTKIENENIGFSATERGFREKGKKFKLIIGPKQR